MVKSNFIPFRKYLIRSDIIQTDNIQTNQVEFKPIRLHLNQPGSLRTLPIDFNLIKYNLNWLSQIYSFQTIFKPFRDYSD